MKQTSRMRVTGLLMAVVALTMIYSCSDDDNSGGDSARVKVSMTDAPGDYDAVYVDVVDVMVKSEASADEEGWTSLTNVEAGVYNLLELTGGVTQLLANAEVEAGYLSQIRLVLGNNNTVVINGESQPLSTPSAQQSGLKIQVNQELEAGQEYEFLLDFDVDQSIVSAGSSGGFILKPVIRASSGQENGEIKGAVHPTTFQSVVKATNANTTISAYTDANGEFVLNGVPAGTYQISVTPAIVSGLNAKIINNVEVSAGASIDLETIFLN
ncbi:DUF4382 domain-containing protein [Gillisia sp. M10.2A]|uniref:DUF4382 domain-containing protein n=1 Tax=Gillisia lutea TaxID=2909668 RepID=A0ABS9ECV7_9FLAO|nr:DUF4382 domain-containing protein [Gillisia lutea]MCF4100703.1 DUF4382 domain-containing protein [Gillisia lutea]